jgi:hypothetical protein
MKRAFLFVMLAACGSSTTTGTDAGVDSGSDVVTTPDSSSDASSPNDSSSDVITKNDSAGGDGGLGAGEVCDPKNDQCNVGLLCCSEPTIDGGTGYFCEKPVNKSCPLLP